MYDIYGRDAETGVSHTRIVVSQEKFHREETDGIIRGAEEYAVFNRPAYRIPRVRTDEDDNRSIHKTRQMSDSYRTFIVSRY